MLTCSSASDFLNSSPSAEATLCFIDCTRRPANPCAVISADGCAQPPFFGHGAEELFWIQYRSVVGEPSRMKLGGYSNKSLPAICGSFFLTWSEVVNYRSLRGVSVLVRLINFGTGDRDGHYQNLLPEQATPEFKTMRGGWQPAGQPRVLAKAMIKRIPAIRPQAAEMREPPKSWHVNP